MNLKDKLLNKRLIVVVVLGIMLFALAIIVGAQTTDEAGSAKDPLITKSYLDMKLGDIDGSGSSSGYKKVTLSKGQMLVCSEGTEFMLYQGNATAYSTSDGVVNITVGELVNDGITLGKYCVYLSPDSESGMKATSGVTVFVKGKYSTN